MVSGIFQEIYLDNNATTQPLPQVRDAMFEVLGARFGNPSSAHTTGERSREHLHHARKAIAALIGADPAAIVFTSGGTEANNIVLASALQKRCSASRVVTTQVEHSSVRKYCDYLSDLGVEVIYLPVDRAGRLSRPALDAAITPETTLVSVQWVNSETGVIQPVEWIATLCRQRGVPFHTDAAQAVGKFPINVAALPIDFLSLTAHKFHGPQGVGALYACNHRWLAPLFRGGDQEASLRAGTENVPGIVGLGKAAELRCMRLSAVQHHLEELRDRFENLVLDMVPGTVVNGDREQRVCNTTNLLFPDIDGQALVAQLDRVGIRCSQSSACTNMHPEPSYVLRAMGLSEDEAYAGFDVILPRSHNPSATVLQGLRNSPQAHEQICSLIRERLNITKQQTLERLERRRESLRTRRRISLKNVHEEIDLGPEPTNETETLIFTGKLEKALEGEFGVFKILEHTSQYGIDGLIMIRRSSESVVEEAAVVEFEYELSNFFRHRHPIRQTNYVICWSLGNLKDGEVRFGEGGIRSDGPLSVEIRPFGWMKILIFGDHMIYVLPLQSWPRINIHKADSGDI